MKICSVCKKETERTIKGKCHNCYERERYYDEKLHRDQQNRKETLKEGLSFVYECYKQKNKSFRDYVIACLRVIYATIFLFDESIDVNNNFLYVGLREKETNHEIQPPRKNPL